MLVRELLKGISVKRISDDNLYDINVENISFNTKDIKPNSAFVLVKGINFDPYEKVDEIFNSKNVRLFITEKPLPEKPYVLVENTRKTFGIICRNFFNIDFIKMKFIGITGTNGKTTTNYLIDSILKVSGHKTIRIGTTEYMIVDEKIEANNTTPGIYDIFEMIAKGVKKGATAVCMEVSSHALDQDRVYGLNFDVAIFTNLTGDHLDYHKTMEHYYQSKKKLFTKEYSKNAAINIDYDYGKRLYNEVEIAKYSFSKGKGDVGVIDVLYSLDGINFKVNIGDEIISLNSHLVGRHNLENILGAITACHILGISKEEIIRGVEQFKNVPGRLEKFEKNGAYFFVDYAHTDDALKNVLEALKGFKKGRLITVFGCGGDRDRTKRPRMAKVAEVYSDIVIVTSDNPRTEDPNAIIDEILTGFEDRSKVLVEPDRRIAIKKACDEAKAGDIVLIAGKGHEDYQIIGKTKYHFDDREEVAKNLGVTFEKI
ncbi:UDP-N-acetylmuramoyl-L-alanyl-D-glutamate--2,6-diaminopimelate ligase [Calditerrivibrio sp.]|uniref:UDP-N-acetylmuramoyl-L-alanyl-D-glutamate--2, 6-diaminopimelate ligase n=1 Tax=Calditerrivibrio sp. TaxID=2792612 RepID=UPI003D0C434C